MLMQLDKDVLRVVLSFVRGEDWLRLERVAKFFYRISRSDDKVFWKRLCIEHGRSDTFPV